MKCFTIMPFSVRDRDLAAYSHDSNHWTEVYQGLILPAVRAAGLECERDDEDLSTRLITEKILRKIEEADVILCDLSSYNPNVHLELGWALRADKRFVLIQDDLTTFNFDLNQFYTFQYSHRLQPSAVTAAVIGLSDIINATVVDGERSYSLVSKLSLAKGSIEAMTRGNVQVSMLNELLREIRALTKVSLVGSPLEHPRRVTIPPIRRRADLSAMLIGSTWRKISGLEHIIFTDEKTFHNNHVGHPSWRENKYEVNADSKSLVLHFAVGGPPEVCRFSSDYASFTELRQPDECIWNIVALTPDTPPWGI